MMKTCWILGLLGTVLFIVGGPSIRAESMVAGPFSVEVSRRLLVRYEGAVLFSGDRCVAYRGLKPKAPPLVRTIDEGRLTRKGNVLTLLARDGRNVFRREVMVTPTALQVTFELQVFGATGTTHLQFDLLTPVETLDGSSYEAVTGLLRRSRPVRKGVFDHTEVKPFTHLFQTCLFLGVHSPARSFTLDFNPMGPWQGTSNYGDMWCSSLYHDGTCYHFSMLCSSARNGATFTGKIVVRPGLRSYESLHSNVSLGYTTGFPTTLALNFSDTDDDKTYRLCPANVPPGKPFRWRTPGDVRIVPRGRGGWLRRDFATAARDGAEGVLDLEQPSGQYLMTLNVYDAREDTGPFDVIGPDGPLLRDIRVPRGTFWDKTVPVRFRGDKATVRFAGKWKINALALQLILRDDEDFVLEHPYWNQ